MNILTFLRVMRNPIFGIVKNFLNQEIRFLETIAAKIAGNMLKMENFLIEQISQATGVSFDRIKQLSAQFSADF